MLLGPRARIFEILERTTRNKTERVARLLADRLGISFPRFEHRIDTARIIVEYRDKRGEVLDTFDTGAVLSHAKWQLVEDERVAPKDTYAIWVRLSAARHDGSNNDGYFDALSLTPVE